MGRRPTKRLCKWHIRFVYKETYKLRCPRQAGFKFALPDGDEMKLDEAMPHLRASAVIYADALADELRLYLEDLAFDNRRLFLISRVRKHTYREQCSYRIFKENISRHRKVSYR